MSDSRSRRAQLDTFKSIKEKKNGVVKDVRMSDGRPVTGYRLFVAEIQYTSSRDWIFKIPILSLQTYYVCMYRIMTKTSPSDRSIYKLIRYDDDSLERSSEEVAPLKSDYFVWIDKWGVDRYWTGGERVRPPSSHLKSTKIIIRGGAKVFVITK